MIKTIKKGVMLVFSIMFILLSFNFTTINVVNAEDSLTVPPADYEQIEEQLLDFIENSKLDNEKERTYRIPGSKAEYNSAIYLQNELLKLNKFKPVTNQSTINGIEKFEFQSKFDGKMYASQNVVFKRESIVETNKKILLTAHYDTSFVDDGETKYSDFKGKVKEGINDNAASVALLLTLVKNLDKMPLDFGYDIEVVFFGASSNNYDGSKFYEKGLSDKDAENILLVVNLERIAVGEYNYLYVNEFESLQGKYLEERLYGFKKLKNQNTLDFDVSSLNGLDYTHVGLESDHAVFMKRHINVVSLFSGNYENLMTYGLNEFADKENITFTENDSYMYIKHYYKNFSTNLTKNYNAIANLISHKNFIVTMEKDNGLKANYDFWTNKKIAVAICMIVFAIMVFIFIIIYRNLQKRSKQVLKTAKIDDIVFKITTNISEVDNKDLNDALDKKIKDDTEEK